jgi:hypothetical protein
MKDVDKWSLQMTNKTRNAVIMQMVYNLSTNVAFD